MTKIRLLLTALRQMPRRLFSRISPFALIRDSDISWKCSIPSGTRVYDTRIGDYSYLGRNTLVIKADIGSFCSISDRCYIGLAPHRTDLMSTSPVFVRGNNVLGINLGDAEPSPMERTYIGHDVWIGAGAMIKAGICIGNGAVIGAGSIVVKDVAPYAIVVGCPGREIRKRFDDTTIEQLENDKWWENNIEQIKKMAACFCRDNP